MILKLTKHFQDMMSWRGLDIDDVKSAMEDPDEEIDAYEGKTRVKKDVGNKTIEVVYCREAFRDKPDQYLVITAYYTKS